VTTDLQCERCGEPAAVTIGGRSPWGSTVYYSHHCIEHAVAKLKTPGAERKIIQRQPGALAELTAIQSGVTRPAPGDCYGGDDD
jgi:hypothetical protein